jgi:uncharacterized membrane protein YhhN
VNGIAAGALVAAVVFALGDWWSKAPRRTTAGRTTARRLTARRGASSVRSRDDGTDRRLEYVCKPATLVALLVVAVALDPAAGQDDRRAWFVAALVLCLAGDVLLMLPRDLFIAGLSAFLLGHLCYIVGFWTDAPTAFAFIASCALVLVAVAPVAVRILGALAAHRDLRPAVAAYMIVISVMVASALASGIIIAAAGAVLFAISDSLIAWDRFVRPLAWAGVAIMVTYHVGQALLTCSLLVR